jgi:hypothetical protein
MSAPGWMTEGIHTREIRAILHRAERAVGPHGPLAVEAVRGIHEEAIAAVAALERSADGVTRGLEEALRELEDRDAEEATR